MGTSHYDRVAVIIGAPSGIGCAFALRLAQQGCHVAFADLKPAEAVVPAIAGMDCKAYSECCDLSDTKAIARFGANVVKRFGCVDILVNNAAYVPLNPLAKLQLAEFRKVMAVNVEATLLLSQLFAAGMIERGYGRIVNVISSTTSTPMSGFLAYTISKMASIGMVRAGRRTRCRRDNGKRSVGGIDAYRYVGAGIAASAVRRGVSGPVD